MIITDNMPIKPLEKALKNGVSGKRPYLTNTYCDVPHLREEPTSGGAGFKIGEDNAYVSNGAYPIITNLISFFNTLYGLGLSL
jgi:hypothetical protein